MIEVKHLTKRYGSHTAVSDLSFTVEKGQIYGFLGPNGAGKSTLLKAAMGLLGSSGMVTRGDIWFEGKSLPDVPPKEMRRICGEKIGLKFSHQFVGGGSDGNEVSALGIPTLDGLGAAGDGAHSANEYILIDQYIPRIAMLASFVLTI